VPTLHMKSKGFLMGAEITRTDEGARARFQESCVPF